MGEATQPRRAGGAWQARGLGHVDLDSGCSRFYKCALITIRYVQEQGHLPPLVPTHGGG